MGDWRFFDGERVRDILVEICTPLRDVREQYGVMLVRVLEGYYLSDILLGRDVGCII